MQFLPTNVTSFDSGSYFPIENENEEQRKRDLAQKTAFEALLNEKAISKEISKTVVSPNGGALGRTELLQLRELLSQEGINGDRIDRLNGIIDSGAMVSVQQLEKTLLGEDADNVEAFLRADLTDIERLDLRSFMLKLGFDDKEAGEAISDLEYGGDLDVWRKIQEKISTMPFGETVQVSLQEISALGRAFRLSEDQRNKLEAVFGNGSLDLGRGSMEEALNIISQEMESRRASDGMLKNGDALARALAGTLNISEERKIVSENADNRRSKLAQRSETRITDSVVSDENMKLSRQKGMNELLEDVDSEAEGNESRDQAFLKEKQTEKFLKEHSSEEQKEHSSGSSGDLRENSFLSRISMGGGPASFIPSYKGAAVNTNNAGAQAPLYNEQIFSQVQSGILRNLQNGTTQLTLQLDPGDLGTLSLVLSVRENEVSAVIRADNPETAKLIESQLQKIRDALENQGLKVENLEVQNGLANNTEGQWQSFSEHNTYQRELEQRERLRLLNRLRQLDRLSQNDVTAARNVQYSIKQQIGAANISDSQLYIVA